MSKILRETVDIRRGDVSRSVLISRILEENCRAKENSTCNDICGQWGPSSRQPPDPFVRLEERDTNE